MAHRRTILLDSALTMFLAIILLGPILAFGRTANTFPTPAQTIRHKVTDIGAMPPCALLDWHNHRVVVTSPCTILSVDFDGWYPDVKEGAKKGFGTFLDPRFRNVGGGRVLQMGYLGDNPSILVIGGQVDEAGVNTRFESGFAGQGTGDATFIGTDWVNAPLDYGSWYGSGQLLISGGTVGPFGLAAPHDAHCEPFHSFNGLVWFYRTNFDMRGLAGNLTCGMTAPLGFVESVAGPASMRFDQITTLGTNSISSPAGCTSFCTTGTIYPIQAAKRSGGPVSVSVDDSRLDPGVSGHIVGLSGGATATGAGNFNATTGLPITIFP